MLLGMFIALAAATPAGDVAPLPPALAAAARAYDEAQVKGDKAALEALLADDYRLVNSGGRVETKAQFIADLTAPDFTMAPFTVEQPIARVWANGAVLGGASALSGTDGGKPYAARLRFADVWAKRDGKWQVVFTQAGRAAA